jgi:hypothetical protein
MKHTDDYGNDEPEALIVAVVVTGIMLLVLFLILN